MVRCSEEGSCHHPRMVVATKKTGEPRRMVDFKDFNMAYPIKTHTVEPPFWQLNMITPKTWKTCLDAKENRQHMTFLPQWGRYKYLVTSQRHLAARMGTANGVTRLPGISLSTRDVWMTHSYGTELLRGTLLGL